MRKAGHEGPAQGDLPNNRDAEDTPRIPSPSTFHRLDDLTTAEVRALWWHLRRQHGEALVAERDVILIDGDAGRWPRSRNQRPQVEAGPGSGGGR